jgi:hypothetical protein
MDSTELTGPSKNKIDRDRKKLIRKKQTAITTLCRGEDLSYEDLTVSHPTGKLLVTHFGNGDERDQDLLLDYCGRFGSVKAVTVLPGTNYAHVEFFDAQCAETLLEHVKEESAETKQTNIV